jgi:hypothetical protein
MAAMMSRRMVSDVALSRLGKHILTNPQLSKDEEGEETEVRREDQDKINRFSTLHQREKLLQAELKTKEVLSIPTSKCATVSLTGYSIEGEGGSRRSLVRTRAC